MAWFEQNEDRELRRDVNKIAKYLKELAEMFERFVNFVLLPKQLVITQEGEMAIKGVPQGGSGVFAVGLLPVGSALPAGAVLAVAYKADDPNVVLTPSADGSSVTAAVPANDAQGSAPAGQPPSFNLTATGTSTALPGPITSGPVNVPILPAAVSLPTALSLNQIS